MAINGVSIVILTKGRIFLLEKLLESVCVARKKYKNNSEVILVDDSTLSDSKKIDEMCFRYGTKKITYCGCVPEKRNVGAEAAEYDVILFLDSDCVATPNIINEHIKYYNNEKVGGVAGCLEFIGKDSWFWKVVEKTPFTVCFGFPKWMDTVPWTPTANCSIRKKIFKQICGFNKVYKKGGEDVDFGLRMLEAGYFYKCSSDALVYHNKKTWSSFSAMANRVWRWGTADYHLAKNHEKYRMKIMPRKTFIYIICLLVLFLLTLILHKFMFFVLIPLGFLVDMICSSLFINLCSPSKKTKFVRQVFIQLLIQINEFGYVFTCLMHGKPSFVNQDVVYFDGQMDGIQETSSILVWSNLISLTMLLIFILCIVFFL